MPAKTGKMMSVVDVEMREAFKKCCHHIDASSEVVAEICESWLKAKYFAHELAGDVNSYCSKICEAVDDSRRELQALRQQLLTEFDAANQTCDEDLTSEGSRVVPCGMDIAKHHDHVDVEMVNLFSSASRVAADEINFDTIVETISEDVPHAMLQFIVLMTSPSSPTHFRPSQALQMLNKCDEMLKQLPDRIGAHPRWIVDAHASGKSAPCLLNEIVAAFIYSVDAKDCSCKSTTECVKRQLEENIAGVKPHRQSPRTPANFEAAGNNGSHWAMMNWAERVVCDGDSVPTCSVKDVEEALSIVKFFLPLRKMLNSGLKIFPKKPRVVFRGINVSVAHLYKIGSEVCFAPFTSTSLVGEEAMKFVRRRGTYFVIRTHSGAMISEFSHYPEQEEALLSTGTRFIVTSKMSRTLQQMLGNDFDVVFMIEKGSNLSPEEQIEQLVEGTRTTEFVYHAYANSYVEARVSEIEPNLQGTQTNGTTSAALPLYKATTHFVESSSKPMMMLLGSGGAGKTSALVGCLCHLMKLKSGHAKPLLPIFISLPSVGQSIHEPEGLDRHLQAQTHLDDAAFKLLPYQTRVVILFDSLDEVVANPTTGASILAVKLLEINPWCSRCKVVVSCRSEFVADNDVEDAKTVLSGNDLLTQVYHVWPFNDDDRDLFMQRSAADRIAELARREAKQQYTKLRDTFQLTDEQLSHPCVLRIATNVLSSLKGEEGEELQNMFTLYDKFVRGSLSDLNEDSQSQTVEALQQIALSMSQRSVWHIPVKEVRSVLQETVDGVSVDELLPLIPSRCEDLHNPEALWGFWHKTVGEFLAAQALRGNAELAASVKQCNSATYNNLDSMTKLAQALDTYVFVPNPENIRETMERLLSQKSYTHIDMSPIGVSDEDCVVFHSTPDGDETRMEPSWAVWVEKHLGDINMAHRPVRITLPIFRNVKHLDSIVFKDAVWLVSVTLDVRKSFPVVESFAPNFEVRGVKSVMWPSFPLVTALPNDFVAHKEDFPTPEQLSNVQELGEGINFSLTEANAGLNAGSYLKVRKVPDRCCLGVKKGRRVVLPDHWQSRYVVGPSICTRTEALNLAASLLQGERPTILDLSLVPHWAPCPVNDATKPDVLSFIEHFQYPLKVILPEWDEPPASASTIGCFGMGEQLELTFTPSNPKLHLVMTNSFKDVQRVKKFHVCAEVVDAPTFRSLKEMLDTKKGWLTNHRWIIEAYEVRFPGNGFENCTKIGNHVRLDGATRLSLPRFSSVLSVGDRFLSNNSAEHISFPADALPKCRKIGSSFLEHTPRLTEFQFPVLPYVRHLGDSTLCQSSVRKVIFPEGCLDQCKTIGALLRYAPNLKSIKLPRFSSLVSIGDSFFAGSNVESLEMSRDAFPSCTAIGEDFLRDTKRLEGFVFPLFPSVRTFGENALRNSVVKHVYFPPLCLDACSTMGLLFKHAPNLHSVELPAFSSLKYIVVRMRVSPLYVKVEGGGTYQMLRVRHPPGVHFLPLLSDHQKKTFLLLLENTKNSKYVNDTD